MSNATNPMFCDECNSAVRVERTESKSLKAVCACGERLNLCVNKPLPDRWSA